MGQAKLRGPRDARVAAAIERNRVARIAEEQRRAEAKAAAERARQEKLDTMASKQRQAAVRIHVNRGTGGGLRRTAMIAALGLAMLPDPARGGSRHG